MTIFSLSDISVWLLWPCNTVYIYFGEKICDPISGTMSL